MTINLYASEVSIERQDSGYAYAYGMVSGMHPRILSRKDIDSMINMENIQEVLNSLRKTDYAREIEETPKEFSDKDLDKAACGNFMRAFKTIADSIPEEDRASFSLMVLGEADLNNMKTIMRGLKARAGKEEVRMMLRQGSIPTEDLELLIGQNSVEELVSKIMRLEVWPTEGLENALIEFKKSESLIPLEMALDRMLIERWLSNKPLQDYVKMRIDLTNMLNLFRCKTAGIKYENYIIQDGLHLSKKVLEEISEASGDDMVKALSGTPYGGAIEKAVSNGISLLRIENSLEEFLQEEVAMKAMLNPLSIWPALALMQLKQRENRNVRMMLLMKAHNKSSEAVRNAMD